MNVGKKWLDEIWVLSCFVNEMPAMEVCSEKYGTKNTRGMKSTEVQNPRRILHRVAYYANARARKLTTPYG